MAPFGITYRQLQPKLFLPQDLRRRSMVPTPYELETYIGCTQTLSKTPRGRDINMEDEEEEVDISND
jgi:hypothetical protein